MSNPRFMIAAGASGSGKTLITCGILQALKMRGLQVTSFKCGPDYIDPMFHSQVLKTKSRNIDTFFTDSDTARSLFAKNSKKSDISVFEGVMGYYDGIAGTTARASAYEVATVTETPVLLLVNCKGMSVSMVPYILGFLKYKENSQIQGVILNQISPMLYPRMKALIEEQLPVRVYGYVPKLTDCVLESRHLGLVMPEEIEDLNEKLTRLGKILEESLELDEILKLAKTAPDIEEKKILQREQKYDLRIAVAKDEAFCFFYEDNLKLLEEMGAKLIFFSPIHDKKLPENIQGLLLNGGYPELYAKELSQNQEMREQIAKAMKGGLPCIAECGGFLYLHDTLEDKDGNPYKMVGILDGDAYYTKKLSRFGYITLEGTTVFGKEVGKIPAHEFHYYDSTICGEDFVARKPESNRSWKCMNSSKDLFAGFPHLYYYGNEKIPEAFLNRCLEYRQK